MDLQWLPTSSGVLNFFIFLFILSLMMWVHELGHFITARRAGIVVEEFGFGLPPRIAGYRHKGVLYSLNYIPFGAFVRMQGENGESDGTVGAIGPASDEDDVPQMDTAPLNVDQPLAGSPEGSFANKSKLTRIIVLMAGSVMNFLLAVVVFSIAYMTGWPTPVADEVQIGKIAPASPAESAGLRTGDLILAVDGQGVSSVEGFQQVVRQKVGNPINLDIQRGDEKIQATLTPRTNPPQGEGAIGVQIEFRTQPVAYSPLQSIGLGFMKATSVIAFTVWAPVGLIQGVLSPDMLRPIGLPGMAQVTSQAVEATRQSGYLYPLLATMGTFSAGLAFANMLPIPALDGGRLFFIFVEAIRGRRISAERESLVHFVGIVVLIALMVLIAVNDIRNPFGSLDFGLR